ncbi:MAG: cobalamin biosynthesis protein [Rhizobium sp.]|jgi:cobalamin biosynthesis protein CbiG|nr:cobalamin biosynthesis protein [Rhizobium sp.]
MARTVVIGIGVTEAALAREAVALVEKVLGGPLKDARPVAIATIFGRAEHIAIQGVAGYLGVPVVVFDAARLEQETPRLHNPSVSLYERIGCHGVAEAAALAAAGPGAILLVGKTKVGGVTVAVAATN